MKRALTWLGLGICLTLAAIIGVGAYLSWMPAPDVHRPTGYMLTANVFLRHGLLRLDETTGRVDLAENASPAARQMYSRTFLPGDVADFNGGQRSVFKVANGQLADIDRTRHNVALPFGAMQRWNGSLRYRPTHAIEATLRGVGVQIDVRELTAPLLREESLDETTIRGDRQAEPVSRASAEEVNLFGYPRDYLGKVHLAEDKIVVNKRTATPDVMLSVSGKPLPRGNRAWLAPGDLLKIEWSPGPRQRSAMRCCGTKGGGRQTPSRRRARSTGGGHAAPRRRRGPSRAMRLPRSTTPVIMPPSEPRRLRTATSTSCSRSTASCTRRRSAPSNGIAAAGGPPPRANRPVAP